MVLLLDGRCLRRSNEIGREMFAGSEILILKSSIKNPILLPGRSLNNDEEDRFGYVDVVEKQEEEEDDDEQEVEEELSYRTLPCWKHLSVIRFLRMPNRLSLIL